MERYNGNNAYRIRIQEREEQRLERRDNPKYEHFVKNRRKEIIGSMLIIMAAALVIILRYAQISVLNTELQEANMLLEEARAERAYMEIERDRVIDLANIEDIAVNIYGMRRPTRDQIVYINVARDDSVKISGTDIR